MRINMAPLDTSASALQALLKRLWIHGFLAGVGVLCVVLLICYFIWGWPFATPESPEDTQPTPTQALEAPVIPPAPGLETPPSPRAAVSPPATLEAELSGVLDKLEEANRKKDLQQLLSLYSPSFPDLPQKAQEISRSWASYDYLSLNFKLTEIKTPTPESATARVTWKIKARQRQTQKIKDTTKVYLVSFTRESDQWRIQDLQKVGKLARSGRISMRFRDNFRSILLSTLLLVLAGACAAPPPPAPGGTFYLKSDHDLPAGGGGFRKPCGWAAL